MSIYVVDASVSVKWFVPEVHSDIAATLLEGTHRLLVPDLLYAEAANALWKKVALRRELSPEEAEAALAGLRGTPLVVHAARDILPLAFRIATRFTCTVYDACYLALGELHACRVLTADDRVHRRLPAREHPRIRLLTDLPTAAD